MPSVTCRTPSGCGPSWLTTKDRTVVPTTARTTGRQPTGRKPRAAGAFRPSGRTAIPMPSRPAAKKAASTDRLVRSGKSQKAASPISGAATRKASTDQPGRRWELFSIKGLAGPSKLFDS